MRVHDSTKRLHLVYVARESTAGVRAKTENPNKDFFDLNHDASLTSDRFRREVIRDQENWFRLHSPASWYIVERCRYAHKYMEYSMMRRLYDGGVGALANILGYMLAVCFGLEATALVEDAATTAVYVLLSGAFHLVCLLTLVFLYVFVKRSEAHLEDLKRKMIER